MSISFSGAFRQFNATLKNPQWACSAEAPDGSIVMTCWAHMLKCGNKKLTYQDDLSQWLNNINGRNLLAEHLRLAMENDRAIKMVLVRAEDAEAIARGESPSKIKKTFCARKDVEGKIASFDGMRLEIEFEAQKKSPLQ